MSFKMREYRKDGVCLHLPDAVVYCVNGYHCDRCEIADRISKNTGRAIVDRPLLGYRDAIPQTPSKNGETWFRMPVLLSAEALERLKLPPSLRYQVIIAEDGPGVFKHNPCGEIDGVLYADLTVHVTVTRNECYGMPNERACHLYDEAYPRYRVKKLVDFFNFSSTKSVPDFKSKRRDVH